MADFVAVLKKTLEGLSDTTPQSREKLYEKARITISSKLAAMNPPLPEAVMARQKQALEDAIVRVEDEYARKPSNLWPNSRVFLSRSSVHCCSVQGCGWQRQSRR
jgi:hypothetical protein